MKEDFLERAKTEIATFFTQSQTKIFTFRDISHILDSNKIIWHLSKNTTIFKFIDFLLQNKILKKITIDFPYRKTSRYLSDDALSIFKILLSTDKNSYFTHSTALFLLGLTDSLSNTIYLNIEQAAHKIYRQHLKQPNIDLAFSRSQRVSNNIAKFQKYKVCLLNGKFTKKLGVIEIEKSQIGTVAVTNIERTLIDLTVRPVYANGVSNVLKIYKKTKSLLSVKKLAETLVKLDYIYPYHQAIGFYLDKSKVYEKSHHDLFKKFGLKYDFYLTHNMSKTEYSKEWRIYYPSNID